MIMTHGNFPFQNLFFKIENLNLIRIFNFIGIKCWSFPIDSRIIRQIRKLSQLVSFLRTILLFPTLSFFHSSRNNRGKKMEGGFFGRFSALSSRNIRFHISSDGHFPNHSAISSGNVGFLFILKTSEKSRFSCLIQLQRWMFLTDICSVLVIGTVTSPNPTIEIVNTMIRCN